MVSGRERHISLALTKEPRNVIASLTPSNWYGGYSRFQEPAEEVAFYNAYGRPREVVLAPLLQSTAVHHPAVVFVQSISSGVGLGSCCLDHRDAGPAWSAPRFAGSLLSIDQVNTGSTLDESNAGVAADCIDRGIADAAYMKPDLVRQFDVEDSYNMCI